MYAFRCREGHRWQASGQTILNGNWCKRCATAQNARNQFDPHGLQRLQTIAAGRGGECLSATYRGSQAKHRFRCSEGHEWDALANGVVRGSWCLRCRYLKMRLGIAVAHQVAAERGGLCLTGRYTRSDVKMQWQCHLGHIWNTAFDTVRAGHWCPVCADLARIVAPNSKARLRHVARKP